MCSPFNFSKVGCALLVFRMGLWFCPWLWYNCADRISQCRPGNRSMFPERWLKLDFFECLKLQSLSRWGSDPLHLLNMCFHNWDLTLRGPVFKPSALKACYSKDGCRQWSGLLRNIRTRRNPRTRGTPQIRFVPLMEGQIKLWISLSINIT